MNLKAARLLGLPHIPCNNHLLNNEINLWIKNSQHIKSTLDKVKDYMTKVKKSLKNSAVLRSITRLHPEVGNATRWTSWGSMMMKFMKIRDSLIECATVDGTTIEVDESVVFRRRCEKVTAIFQDINMVAISMQTRLYKLCSCRNDLDALIQECADGNDDRGSGWWNSKLPGLYITPDSEKLPDPDFVRGVIKMQENNHAQLTSDEKEACSRLLVEQEDGNQNPQQTSLAERMRERIRKRKAGVLEVNLSSPYKNVDFICGSAAEVERLWSLAKNVLTNSRSRLTPVLFETLLFLKVNEGYWDIHSVQHAHTLAIRNAQKARVAEMVNEHEDYNDEM